MLAPWYVAVPALALIAVAGLLAALRGRPRALPAADAPSFRRAARRTRALRVGLAAAAGGVLAAAFLTAPRPAGELGELVSAKRHVVVVLDLSHSVSDLAYREIARTLEGIMTAAGDDGSVGLVLFSDTALEALPPGSRPAELAPFIRFFRPLRERGVASKPVYYRAAGPTEQIRTRYPLSPWIGRFSGGTQISTGLRVARVALERDGLAGRVVLISDLAEAEEDFARLTRELVAYEQNGDLELRIVALPPATQEQKTVFQRVTGERGLVLDSLALATGNQGQGEPAEPLPWTFLAAVLALALVLAASELLAVPLRWRASAPGTRG